MAWLSRVNFISSDTLSFTDINNLGNDIRAWGDNVNGGGYTLSNVVLSASSGTMATVTGGTGAASTLTIRSTSGTGTSDAIVFQTASQSERMRITTGGNVGIGTASPGGKLTIVSGDSATASNQVIISGGRSVSGGAGAILFTNSFWNSGFGAANIVGLDSGGSGGHLSFGTLVDGGGVSGTPTEKMRILQNGNVGIGTASPAYQTQVSGSGQTTAALTDSGNKGGSILIADTGAAGGNGGALLFAASVTNGLIPGCAIKSLLANGSANGQSDLAFSTRNAASDTSLTERMRITSGGNVGIGTTTPATSAKLEIAGTTGALLVPRLTTTERDALTAVNGMIIYNTTDNQMQGRINGAWVAM